MCYENESRSMIVHRVYVYTDALGKIRGSGRKSVSLHRASRHAVTDVTPYSNTAAINFV
jgi:hypothetical protein